MTSNMRTTEECIQLQPVVREPSNITGWEKLINKEVVKGTLKGRTCKIYSAKLSSTVDRDARCVCGRLARRHSYTGGPKTEYQGSQKWKLEFAAEVDVTIYGQLANGARFIRCDSQNPINAMETLVQLITDDMTGTPKLLISCFGGAKGFTMTDSLEREFMSGIGQLATTKDVWVLTTGLNAGVSKLIGQGINRHILLHEKTSKPTVIGMTSWGTITDDTRLLLKAKVSSNNSRESMPTATSLAESSSETLDINHSHFLLFDEGNLCGHLNDVPRDKFVQAACEQTKCHPVTIIVEGGFHTLEVIINDLKKKRPVVIVAGSGRLSNVLGEILENITDSTIIEKDEVERQLRLCHALWPSTQQQQEKMIEKIKDIFEPSYRRYLSVFRLRRDTSLTNTIFRAVFDTQEELKEPKKLLELAVSWDYVDGAHDILQRIEPKEKQKHYQHLFEQALKENRPLFVDYFLRQYHDPLETTLFMEYKCRRESNDENQCSDDSDDGSKTRTRCALKFIIKELYRNYSATWSINSPDNIDEHYSQLIGCYIDSLYRNRKGFKHFKETLSSFCKSTKPVLYWSRHIAPSFKVLQKVVALPETPEISLDLPHYSLDKPYKKQEMLRDLFLWSVYARNVDIAFVLLLQLESRIGAALVAAAMAERLSFGATYVGIQNKYNGHRIAYEEYATACINACYRRNERLACQLLLREIPLFGNITCMQVAIASGIVPVVNTDCFNHVLDQQWYGYLDKAPKNAFLITCKFILSLTSFGLLAPLILDYRSPDDVDNTEQKDQKQTAGQSKPSDSRKLKGVEYQLTEKPPYWQKFRQFHGSPIIKMFYEFIAYIWYLMVFSYMMLFQMRSSSDSMHWTEIYVIVAVSASFIEDMRKIIIELHTQMLERWHRKSLTTLFVHATPYILFYVGIGLHFASMTQPTLFTPARIVLAIDLELWYIFSLRYVSAIKLLGPKLFMMKNMMRYLAAALYIILVSMTAYGVVSRALTMYSSLQFTAASLFRSLFYRPYWFIYSVVEDERDFLDKILESDISSPDQITEATVTHVLLAFHILFINILILNLLIAVFNFVINDIQVMNEYYWRYQRYELIREYFEKPKFAFPPFSLLVYILMLIRLIYRRRMIPRVFKILATPELDKAWTDFENAATYEYARDFVEEKYRSNIKVPVSSSVNRAESSVSLQTQVDALKEKMTQMQKNIELQTHTNQIDVFTEKMAQLQRNVIEMQAHTKQMVSRIDWMMKTMAGVETPGQQSPSFEIPQSPIGSKGFAVNK